MIYLLLLLSFVILIKGADIFIEASSKVAKVFNIPELIIGIVIVGFGTSLPELAVNMAAVTKGSTSMAVGNIVGSNIFNILFIVGVIAIYKPMIIDDKIALFDFPMAILAAFALPFFAIDQRFFPMDHNFSRFDGAILLIIFVYYCWQTIVRSLVDEKLKEKKMMIYEIGEGTFSLSKYLNKNSSQGIHGKKHIIKDFILILVGLFCVIKGGDMVIKYASSIAKDFGMSDHLVGLTIVGIGTSLPELAVSIIAARKNQQAMVIGNIVGSNTFNILFTLGLTMIIKPIEITHSMLLDSINVGFTTVLVGVLAILNRKVGKKSGAILIFIYIVYMYSVISGS